MDRRLGTIDHEPISIGSKQKTYYLKIIDL